MFSYSTVRNFRIKWNKPFEMSANKPWADYRQTLKEERERRRRTKPNFTQGAFARMPLSLPPNRVAEALHRLKRVGMGAQLFNLRGEGASE